MANGPITDTGINTELEVLRSRDLIGKLVDTLDLTNQPDFNPLLREPRLLNQIKTQLFDFFGMASEKPKILEIFTPSEENDLILTAYFKYIQ